MKIEMGKKYVYRAKCYGAARVLCVDAQENRPIISLSGDGSIYRHYADGRYGAMNDHGLDLIEAKPEPVVEWGVAKGDSFSTMLTPDAAREWVATYSRVWPGWRVAKRIITTEIVD